MLGCAEILLLAAMVKTPHCVPEEPAVLIEPVDGGASVRAVEPEEQPGSGLYYLARLRENEQVTFVPRSTSGKIEVIIPPNRNSPAAREAAKEYTVTGSAVAAAGGSLQITYVLELYRDGKCCGRREIELQLRAAK